MSQIENSRICSIAANANQRNGQSHSVESTNPFLKTPLRSVRQFSNSPSPTTSSEKRLNYALQSRKTPSDDQITSEKNLEFKSEAFQRGSKNRSTFEFWQQFHSQRESEPSNEKDPNRGIFTNSSNSPQSVEHLQAAICNVNLGSGDGTMSADNKNGVSTRSQPAQEEKLDVAIEVETVQNEGGDEALPAETAASSGTRDTTAEAIIAEASTSAQYVSTGLQADNQQQLLKQQSQQNSKHNHKPILKRQEAPLGLVTLSPAATLPPPILKKRDSFSGTSISTSECHSNASQSLASNVQNGKLSAHKIPLTKLMHHIYCSDSIGKACLDTKKQTASRVVFV